MKSGLVLGLALAALSVTASAQKYQQPKVKPSHNSQKEARSQRPVKTGVPRDNAAQELRKVEQAGVHANSSRKATVAKSSRPVPVRALKQDSNPPIHVAGGGGPKRPKGGKGNTSSGRLRHKGSHR